jgi:MraZ protein
VGESGLKMHNFETEYDYRQIMSFIGQFPVRLDAKNRAFMPAGFRRILQQSGEQTLVVRKDYYENCLVVYPASQWRDEIAKVRAKLNRFDGNQQMVYRKLVSEAQELQLDSNGRILFPQALLDKVEIKQDALFVGMEQTIEIWAPDMASAGGQQPFMSDADFADSLKKFMTE